MEPIAYLQTYTYLGIFLLSLLGQFGFPISEEVIFIGAGYLASAGAVNFWCVLIFSIFVILLIDTGSYWEGYFFGNRILRFFSRWRIFKKVIKRTERFFKKYGKKTIFVTRFVWNVRNWSPVLAGCYKMGWWNFIKADALAAMIYTPFLIAIGYFFSEILQVAIGEVFKIRSLIFLLFIVVVIILILRKIYKKLLPNLNNS